MIAILFVAIIDAGLRAARVLQRSQATCPPPRVTAGPDLDVEFRDRAV
jgi:hypothetical protein